MICRQPYQMAGATLDISFLALSTAMQHLLTLALGTFRTSV